MAKKKKGLVCKCSSKNVSMNPKKYDKNPKGKKSRYVGKCDVYEANGDIIVIPPEERKAKVNPEGKKGRTKKKNPSKAGKTGEKWMQGLNLKEGSLTKYIVDEYGKDGFETSKKSGNLIIKESVLKEMKADKSLPEKRQREANLALIFRKPKKKK